MTPIYVFSGYRASPSYVILFSVSKKVHVIVFHYVLYQGSSPSLIPYFENYLPVCFLTLLGRKCTTVNVHGNWCVCPTARFISKTMQKFENV